MALYLLLKAVVTKTITVPQYTRADGTIVPAHQKTVHYDPDHTQEDVINGRGTHSQKLAHEQLKKHKDWDKWSDDEKEAHVRAHGMDIHKKRMQADAVSRFKAAFGKEGKMPQSGHYLAFLNESPEKQEKILDGLKKKHGETHVHNIMDKLHERSVKNGDKQPEKTAEQPKQAEQKPQQKPEAKPVQKPEKQPEQEAPKAEQKSTGPSIQDAYGMLTDEEKQMLNSDVNADATFRANIGKTDIHEKMKALSERPFKKISSTAEHKARLNESKALQLAHKVTLAHAQKQTAQQKQETAEKPAEQPKKSKSQPTVEQAFSVIHKTLHGQLDDHLKKTGPKQIERVQAFVKKVEANMRRLEKEVASGEAEDFTPGVLKAQKEFLPRAKNALERLVEQKAKDDKEAAHLKQFPHIRGVKVPEGLDEAGTKHFKEYLRKLAYSSDKTDLGSEAKEFIRQAKVGIKSYEEKLKVADTEFYRDSLNNQKAALAAAEALDGIADDPNFQKKILNAREKAYGKQEESATQQEQKKTDTGPKEGDVKTVNGKQYVLQGGRWRRADKGENKADSTHTPEEERIGKMLQIKDPADVKPAAKVYKSVLSGTEKEINKIVSQKTDKSGSDVHTRLNMLAYELKSKQESAQNRLNSGKATDHARAAAIEESLGQVIDKMAETSDSSKHAKWFPDPRRKDYSIRDDKELKAVEGEYNELYTDIFERIGQEKDSVRGWKPDQYLMSDLTRLSWYKKRIDSYKAQPEQVADVSDEDAIAMANDSGKSGSINYEEDAKKRAEEVKQLGAKFGLSDPSEIQDAKQEYNKHKADQEKAIKKIMSEKFDAEGASIPARLNMHIENLKGDINFLTNWKNADTGKSKGQLHALQESLEDAVDKMSENVSSNLDENERVPGGKKNRYRIYRSEVNFGYDSFDAAEDKEKYLEKVQGEYDSIRQSILNNSGTYNRLGGTGYDPDYSLTRDLVKMAAYKKILNYAKSQIKNGYPSAVSVENLSPSQLGEYHHWKNFGWLRQKSNQRLQEMFEDIKKDYKYGYGGKSSAVAAMTAFQEEFDRRKNTPSREKTPDIDIYDKALTDYREAAPKMSAKELSSSIEEAKKILKEEEEFAERSSGRSKEKHNIRISYMHAKIDTFSAELAKKSKAEK